MCPTITAPFPLLTPASTNNILALASASTLKSTSAPASLNTAPPLIVTPASPVKSPVTSNVPAMSILVSNIELTIVSSPITKSIVPSPSW